MSYSSVVGGGGGTPTPPPAGGGATVGMEAVYWHHNDHLGTPQAMTDSNGIKVWEVSQTPFGIATVNNDPDGDGLIVENNFRFPGQYFDSETGLSYNYQRTYDPTIGAYKQSDPIGLDGGSNTYVYTSGNPVKWSDRLGLLVDAVYDSKTGLITVTDRNNGQSISISAASGGKPFGKPIPQGKYEILDQARNPESFRIDAWDSLPRNDIHEPTGRDRFRLHEPGRTIGCIAATERDQWNKLRNLINNTTTETVSDNATPWWKPWSPAETIVKYGDLIVR